MTDTKIDGAGDFLTLESLGITELDVASASYDDATATRAQAEIERLHAMEDAAITASHEG